MSYPTTLPSDIASCVRRALSEDIGTGDLTAELIPEDALSQASVICRESAILCGTAWFDEVFKQLNDSANVSWSFADGDQLNTNDVVCKINGATRSLLTGERTALNFLQLLSGTATLTQQHVQAMGETSTRLLDTRKTVPGLRTAQKYAVACGGGMNHRMGLYDAILIKENHIQAAGSITQAIEAAKKSQRSVEVEVESLDELSEAINAGADSILLDNFDLKMMQAAVKENAGRAKLEVSGGVQLHTLSAIASTGVDYISVGALTKHVMAIDFSMLFQTT